LENDNFDHKKIAGPFICPSRQNMSSNRSEATNEFKSDTSGKSLSQKAKV
jgi:hypothetical protein